MTKAQGVIYTCLYIHHNHIPAQPVHIGRIGIIPVMGQRTWITKTGHTSLFTIGPRECVCYDVRDDYEMYKP